MTVDDARYFGPMSSDDGITPDRPEADGLAEPQLSTDQIEGARLLGNEARHRLRSDGFSDAEIDAWAATYYVAKAGGSDEGDDEGLIAFIAAEQSAGRKPI